jgi:uncharacterized protein (DUF885 family)
VLLLLAVLSLHDADQARPRRYEDLVSFFTEWRTFQRPRLINGVPDYRPAAMTAQQKGLITLQRRLASFDTTSWSVAQQVDYRLVQAELNGLDFDHRVLRPWEKNPAFYVTVFLDQSDQPAREGPSASGSLELWSYRFPLSAQDAEAVRGGLRTVPPLLAQARQNLTGDARDLWLYGSRSIKDQSSGLDELESRVKASNPDLLPDIRRARQATDSLSEWLDAKLDGKKGSSGVGIENYTWYLRNVQLLPYTWQDEVALMERELGRAIAFLKLEEERNRKLPALVPVSSAQEHTRRFTAAVTEYMTFLKSHDLLTLKPYMEPALRARTGSFLSGPRDFFTEVDYRDPVVMRTHGYHWFDLARMSNEPHSSPIRRGPLLYNIFNTRTEGLATGWEEMMLQAGMFDARPRSRELIYVLVAQRAARAIGELMMHANRMTLDQAAEFASANTPRGWLRTNMATVWGEQHLYLQQPGYGISYLTGKFEIERLMARRTQQLGDQFTLKRFMDELNAAGLIPITMIGWEMTGERPR